MLAVPGDLLRVMMKRAFPRSVALAWLDEEPFELLSSWFGEGAATCLACLPGVSKRSPQAWQLDSSFLSFMRLSDSQSYFLPPSSS